MIGKVVWIYLRGPANGRRAVNNTTIATAWSVESAPQEIVGVCITVRIRVRRPDGWVEDRAQSWSVGGLRRAGL